MIALSLGFAPRTHAPPELNYNFAASVQTGLNPAVAYAISAEHNVVSVALPHFMQYKSGVYTRSTAAAEFHPVGRHAVRVIGWGEEGGTPYWLVANSWSREFGENGYFRIRRGTNEAGIESKAGAGLPAM